ncbi:MAG: transglycosylase SLT domain-containing protein, partial [Burkholderiaceae bacterium]
MQRFSAAPCALIFASLAGAAMASDLPPDTLVNVGSTPQVASVAPSLPQPDPLGALLFTLPAMADDLGAEPPVPPRDIWERIRRGFAMQELDTPIAEQRTRWYAGQPEYFARMSKRAGRYLYHIVEEVEARGMPTELALLPFVESAFQPEAQSVAKAAGLWQFVPATGKDFDLAQNMWKDERRDVLESTRAALDYLQKLYNMFGDWHLALAAYNWGEGSVSRAIEKNRKAGKGTGYLDLKMPLETQHYVPKLQAVKNLVATPENFNLRLPAVENEPYFVRVDKERDIDVKTAAKLAEMKLDEFIALNPSFNRPVIVASHNT